mmetsp:Transcript_31965/g.72943  ORF Transcript_31965/g.72943 Transcript_31965/m.72943 type:complete len:333 (+) Transcript_31965:63-1061(+)
MPEKPGTSVEVAIAISAYMACSSGALVVNKVVMTYLQAPGLVFFIQLLAAVGFLAGGSVLRLLEVDGITWVNVKQFLPYIISFVACLYSNGKALAASNIETVIVFRACTPLFVSVLDYVFLGREFPSPQSLTALAGVVFGAVLYVQADGEFAISGIAAYKWVIINLLTIVFDMIYGKALISGISFKNPVWGSVLYSNLLALVPMGLLGGTEISNFDVSTLTTSGIVWLVLSCVLGTGMSWASWNCRNKTSATVFTLLGVVCKFMSVLMNIMIWDKHASNKGLLALALCLFASSMYRQAPKRSHSHEPPAADLEEVQLPVVSEKVGPNELEIE